MKVASDEWKGGQKLAKKRHIPPSRLRYEKAHPTISVRVSRDLHDRLKELKAESGKSAGDVLREALDVQEPSVQDAYGRGYGEGWVQAESKYRVDYRCSQCGGTLTIDSREEKRAAAEFMRENGWAHGECLP